MFTCDKNRIHLLDAPTPASPRKRPARLLNDGSKHSVSSQPESKRPRTSVGRLTVYRSKTQPGPNPNVSAGQDRGSSLTRGFPNTVLRPTPSISSKRKQAVFTPRSPRPSHNSKLSPSARPARNVLHKRTSSPKTGSRPDPVTRPLRSRPAARPVPRKAWIQKPGSVMIRPSPSFGPALRRQSLPRLPHRHRSRDRAQPSDPHRALRQICRRFFRQARTMK